MKKVNILDVCKLNDQTVKEFIGTKEYVATGGVEKDKIVTSVKFNFREKPSRANREVEVGEILLAKMKDTDKVLLINDENKDYIYSTGFFTLKPDKAVVNTEYIYYVLKSKYFQEEKNKLAKGATQKALNNAGLKKIKIPVPSKNEQEKIVDVLKTLESTLIKRQQQIEALLILKQSIFLDMFGDPNINIKDYKTKKVIEVCTRIMGGGTPSKKVPEYYIGNIPWVTPKDMKREYIDFSTDYINEDAIVNSSAKLVPKNSLLMVIRSGILKHTLPVAINTKEITVNQDMKAFIIDESQITIDYLFYFFKTMERTILSRVRSVTAHNLKFKDLESMEVPLPDIDSQQEFSRKIFRINETLEKVNEQMINFELLYNSLLHNAFNGELFKEDIKV